MHHLSRPRARGFPSSFLSTSWEMAFTEIEELNTLLTFSFISEAQMGAAEAKLGSAPTPHILTPYASCLGAGGRGGEALGESAMTRHTAADSVESCSCAGMPLVCAHTEIGTKGTASSLLVLRNSTLMRNESCLEREAGRPTSCGGEGP